jgi:ubiquitin carboxyl-terminal hydrolase 36/42
MRQEDAHEFLRMLLDCIHEEILKSHGLKSNSGGKLVDTTLIGRIFGGYLCNELKCSTCSYKSRTYNHFQDLSLDLHSGSVEESIKAFVKPEVLGKGNEWKCDKCNRKVKVTNYFTIF